ncbi:MAG: hypothetical protein AB4060_12905, partial [Crocosphaera sp.]
MTSEPEKCKLSKKAWLYCSDITLDNNSNSANIYNTSMSELNLNLGCGAKRRENYLNVDKFGEPDLKVDLEELPWPWEDNSVA